MVVHRAVDPAVAEMLYLFAMDATDELGQPGKTLGGTLPDAKNTTDIPLGRRGEWEGDWSRESLLAVGYDLDHLDAEVASAIGEVVRIYQSEFNALGGIASFTDSGYQIQRYRKGEGFYRNHVDSDPETQPHRILACVLYLNTVEEGGETQFLHHGISVKPVQGDMTVFPANWLYPHEGRVPISEDKIILTTFIYSAKYL